MNNSLIVKSVNEKITTMLENESKALPSGFNSLRFKQNAMTVLMDLDLSKMQGQEFNIARCIMQGSYLGLDFMNKECYIIPYGAKPQFMTSYLGAKKLCYNFSVRPIRNIYAKVVRDGDVFESKIIDNKTIINFSQKPFSNNKIVGCFAVVEYDDGTINLETMSISDIETVRNKFSKQSRGKAWTDSYEEMVKKTVIHRLCKHIQLNFDTIEGQEAWRNSSDCEFEQKKSVSEVKENIKNDISDLDKENENFIDTEFTDTPFEEV